MEHFSITRSITTSSLLLIFFFFFFFFFCSTFTSTEAYDPHDPNGNITTKWDIMNWTPDGYVAVVTMYNFQKYRHIKAPGWTLGWTWAKKEVIWSMMGSQTTWQGDCSKFKGNIPHCCKKDPEVVDLLPGTPYNQQIANCCKGGVLNPWKSSSFQVIVGVAGTTNKTVRLPRKFTLKAPGPGYTCGPAKIVRPTKFITADKRRVTQALIPGPKDSPHVVIWDALTTEKIAKWPSNHTGSPRWMEHSPTEATFVTCGTDRSVRFWRKLCDVLLGHILVAVRLELCVSMNRSCCEKFSFVRAYRLFPSKVAIK